MRCSGHVQPGGDPRVDPGHARGIIALGWSENALESPGEARGGDWGEGSLSSSAQAE